MSILKKDNLTIKTYGDEVLRAKAEDITTFGEPLRELAEKMYEIMIKLKGIGIAAPQVGVSKKLFIVDLDHNWETALIVANPEITYRSSDTSILEEGCLSVPKVWADVERPNSIILKGFNIEGDPIEVDATGMFARAIQHEYDHIEGILFVDKVVDEQKKLIAPSLKKLKSGK
jgi:peptide deformylase